MKNYFKILYILLAIGGLFSCENEPIMYDSSKNHIAFTTGDIDLAENGGVVGIPVMVAAMLDEPALTVDFMFDETLSDAVLGTDFNILNSTMTLDYPNGWGYDTIWVEPIDNEVFGGNLEFVLKLTANSLNYDFGAQDSIICTIVDNEHPLKQWIGTYDVIAYSYGLPGDWDEEWTVVTSADPADINNLLLTGIGGPDYSVHTAVVAKVDLEAMSITLPGGSEIGTHGLYGGPLAIFLGDESGGIDNETDPMIGEISEDGSIHIDHMAIKFVGGINTGYVWDSFDTQWTKVGKSYQAERRQAPINKFDR